MADLVIELVRSADWSQGVVFVNGHGGNADGDAHAPADTLARGVAARARVVAEHRRRRPARRSRRDVVDAGAGARRGAPRPRRRRPRAGDRRAGAAPACNRSAPQACSATRRRRAPTRAGGCSTSSPRNSPAQSRAGSPVTMADAPSRSTRRYRLDNSVQRFGRAIVGGSPLKLFRVTEPGAAVVDRIAGRRGGGAVGTGHALARGGRDPPRARPLAVRCPRRDDRGADVRRARAGVPAGAVLVDDGSPVPVPGAAMRLGAQPRTRRGAQRRSRAASRPPLVAFVDTDVELPDGWLEPLLAPFRRPTRRRSSRPGSRSPADRSPVAWYERSNSPLDLGPEPARIRAGTRVSYVPAAAIVCRVDALREIGGFDESLRFGEDVDLVWRLDERRMALPVRARGPRSDTAAVRRGAAWARQRIAYGSSTASLARRHPGALAPIRMSGWSVASLGAGRARNDRSRGRRSVLGSAAALDPQAARRAAAGRVRPRRAGQSPRRRPDRQRRPARVVAALAVAACGHGRRAGSCSLRRWRRATRSGSPTTSPTRSASGSGIVAERTLAPLVPEISSWPGRRAAAQA